MSLQTDNSGNQPAPMPQNTPKNLAQQILDRPDVIEDYRARKLSANALANLFGYRESYVLATLSRLGIKRPQNGVSTYQIQKKNAVLASTRREFRDFLAKKVKKSEISLEKAAEIANCSERTMRRYVDKS
jgi:hypothetical protein